MSTNVMFIRNTFFAILVIVINTVKAADNNYKLELVQMMYRHGDRAPEVLYPTDPNPASVWPLGLGALTSQGKREHYSLGKLFREMYRGFLTTKPTEVDAVSTDVDRCLESAEANFASFFAPTPEWKFENDLNWQPIPITSIPMALDKFLGSTYCPAFQRAINRQLNTPSNREFNAKHKELYKYLTIHIQAYVTEYLTAHEVYDILFIEKKYNLKIPSWVPPIFDELTDVAVNTYPLIYNSTAIQRLRAGPVLGLMNEVFDAKVNKQAPELKFRTYSTHDGNIAAVLGALNNLRPEIIHYCATIIFEMYSGSGGNYFIRILYLNTPYEDKSNQTPRVLILPGCEEYCPYEKYLKYTSTYAHIDYDGECNLDSNEEEDIKDSLDVS